MGKLKYSRSEKLAIDHLYYIASALKNGETAELHPLSFNLIQRELGIDFIGITRAENELKKKGLRLKENKSRSLLNSHFHLYCYRTRRCYFPFQIEKCE